MKLAIVVPFLAVLSACGQQSAPAVSQNKPATPPTPPAAPSFTQADPIPYTRDADDAARFLAGLPGKPGSSFADLEQNPAWQTHKRQLDDAWDKADQAFLQGLHEFQRAELTGAGLENTTLFYPFSGPDALVETICFPKNAEYFMVALEPAGLVPTAAQISKKNLDPYLAAVRETVASELGRSFFVTREMDRQFRGQVTDGLMIPILHLLVRSHHTILGVKYVRLDEQGKLTERKANASVDAKYANKGMEIDFRSDEDQSVHRITYISLNLDDAHLRNNQGFHTYVKALQKPVTFLKATSYMTHHPEFSVIRDLILSQSAYIFQDDSGVPYKYFTPATWQVQLYGEYTKPYGSFEYMFEPDLRKAYVSGTAKPLTMHMGYGFQKITSNLLLAKRVTTTP